MSEITEEDRQTLFVAGLAKDVDEEVLYELFLNVSNIHFELKAKNKTLLPLFQAGPLFKVNIPLDHNTKQRKNFGFVRFQHSESVPYAIELFKGIKLFGQTLSMQNRKTGAGMQNNRISTVNNSNSRPHLNRSNSIPQHPELVFQNMAHAQSFQQQQHYAHLHRQQQGFQQPHGFHEQRDRRDYQDRRSFQDQRDQYDRRDHQDRSRHGQHRHQQEERRHHSYDRDDRSQHFHDRNHDFHDRSNDFRDRSNDFRDRSHDFRDRSHDRRHHDRQSYHGRRY